MKNPLHITVITLITLTGITTSLFAQTKIGDNKGTIGAGSLLELESTNKALLLPRMTTSQMNAIPSPVEGMMIFNTTDSCVSQYNEGMWNSLCDEFDFCNVATLDENQNNPNDSGTVFDPPGSEQSTCTYYVGDDGSTWEWNGSTYVASTRPIRVEPWFYSATNKPAHTLVRDLYHLGSTTVGRANVANRGRFSFAVGARNITTGRYSTVIGLRNRNLGDYSFLAGSSNYNNSANAGIIGYGDTITNNSTGGWAIGNSNTIAGDRSVAIGTNNTASGDRGVAIGGSNSITGLRAMALGNNLSVGENLNVAVGRFNEPQSNAIFTVGAGSDETNRQNAIAVLSTAPAGANNQATALVILMPYMPIYPTEAAAINSGLSSGALFRVAGDRHVFIKP